MEKNGHYGEMEKAESGAHRPLSVLPGKGPPCALQKKTLTHGLVYPVSCLSLLVGVYRTISEVEDILRKLHPSSYMPSR